MCRDIIMACDPNTKVCNENEVQDEDHFLVVCLIAQVIREKYVDLLDGHDDVNVIVQCPS